MNNKAKRIMCGLIACSMLALTGCGSTVDNRDDPLSGYSVGSLLPFGTRNPELADSPTPAPSATPGSGTVARPTQAWQATSTARATSTPAPTGIAAAAVPPPDCRLSGAIRT